jgi:hypothetical protein
MDVIKKENGLNVNKLRNINRNKSVVFRLPQPALGEAINKLFWDPKRNEKRGHRSARGDADYDASMRTFLELKELVNLNKDIDKESKENWVVDTVPVSPEALRKANDLMSRDSHLEEQPTDALIVAVALVDADARWLLTKDSLLIGNKAIKEISEEMDRKLQVLTFSDFDR